MLTLLASILLFINGCGYKPASHYSKNAFGNTTYVQMDIDVKSSSQSVLIKDVMNELIISKFNTKLVDSKAKADTVIYLKLNSVSQSAMQTDTEGYVKRYRTTVNISMKYNNKKDKQVKDLTLSDYYDYTVDDDSTITDQKKDESIRIAIQNALSDLFSKIAVSTFK